MTTDTPTPRIVQIAASHTKGIYTLACLLDDGSLWCANGAGRWMRCPLPPPCQEPERQNRAAVQEFERGFYE